MGYARVSSREQNLDRQLLALQNYVAPENILVDKQSGKDLNRPSYQALKSVLGLRSGDTLYITSLDRLSRNKQDLKAEIEWFRKNGIHLKILDIPTTLADLSEDQEWIQDMIFNILIEVLSSMAEQERLTIRKRQREGIEAAKQKGKHLGRPRIQFPQNFEAVHEAWIAGKITATKACQELNISRSTFYRMSGSYKESAPQ
ncbi:MAG: recombinase family protein [Lachnospiraceae bacterium]|nr:recombinase family protein [Lachnospiraceae bacterium]